MAAIITLCALGMHALTIWRLAKKVQSIAFPFNPVVSVHEIPLYNAANQVVAVQLELHTKNGWLYCFCFDVHDHLLRTAILREFSPGTNINRGVCDEARSKMMAARINHMIYFDPSHGHRIFILISPRPIDLRCYAKPHWQPL